MASLQLKLIQDHERLIKQHASPSLFALPPEIFEQIEKNLEPNSVVCLGLTCKVLYERFKPTIRATPLSNRWDSPTNYHHLGELLNHWAPPAIRYNFQVHEQRFLPVAEVAAALKAMLKEQEKSEKKRLARIRRAKAKRWLKKGLNVVVVGLTFGKYELNM